MKEGTRYQIKAAIWATIVVIMFCLLNDHFNPYVYPPPMVNMEQSQSSLKINIGELPLMIYKELK